MGRRVERGYPRQSNSGASVDGKGWAYAVNWTRSGRRRGVRRTGGSARRGGGDGGGRACPSVHLPSKFGSSSNLPSSRLLRLFFAGGAVRSIPRLCGRLGRGRLESLDASAGGLRRTPMRAGTRRWASTCASSGHPRRPGSYVTVVVVLVLDLGHGTTRAPTCGPSARVPWVERTRSAASTRRARGSRRWRARTRRRRTRTARNSDSRRRNLAAMDDPVRRRRGRARRGRHRGRKRRARRRRRRVACAWRLVAHPPLSIQTALPCDCEYEVIESRPDGDPVAARGASGPE